MISNNPEENILYNRLEDILCNVGNNARLKINLNLYKTYVKDNKKDYYLKEIVYIENKENTINRKIVRTMTDGYLSLENTNVKEQKVYIMLFGKDLEYMRIFLLPKLEFLIQNYNQIYEIRKDNKIYINNNFNNPIELQSPTGHYTLWFKPGVYIKSNDESIPCIELYMNSQHTMTSISFPNLYEFMYIIRTIQLQTYFSSMLAYLKKPDLNILQEQNSVIYYSYNKPQLQKPQGFFEKQLQERKNSNM